MLMFANDTKIFGDVSSSTGRESLQADIHRAVSWSEKWQLPFNTAKCKVLHVGKSNPRNNYIIKEDVLAVT